MGGGQRPWVIRQGLAFWILCFGFWDHDPTDIARHVVGCQIIRWTKFHIALGDVASNICQALNLGTDTLIIGGESAGGNLCAATLLRRRDAFAANTLPLKIPFPWKLANLVYGVFDIGGTSSVAAFGDRRLIETSKVGPGRNATFSIIIVYPGYLIIMMEGFL